MLRHRSRGRILLVVNHAPHPSLEARRSPPLRGRVRVPGDKSISHRALIFGALAVGETTVHGLLEGEDVINTARAIRGLGAEVQRIGAGMWRIQGVGIGGFASAIHPLDFGNSGTGCRLIMGAVAGCAITTVFEGDASLRKRPMRRVLDPLERMGARIVSAAEGGRLPLALRGARDPIPIVYQAPVASAQVKSAVLLSGLAAPGETSVIEAHATRDHTEHMLRHFGAEVRVQPFGNSGRRVTLIGQPELAPSRVMVPADPSSAAFPTVAALIVPGSDLILEDVVMNPLRTGIYTTLAEMGASIEVVQGWSQGGEQLAHLRVRTSALHGVEVPPDRVPSMIDEYPILAVAAACAEGTTCMRGLSELRVKESDRLAATAAGLVAAGVAAEVQGDDLLIHGTGSVRGGAEVKTHMDHRIAMSFLILGLASERPITIDDGSFIATSFPGFVALMQRLGATLD
jgi:3-phosphoshikimate 1-carboxyvinyltransferase